MSNRASIPAGEKKVTDLAGRRSMIWTVAEGWVVIWAMLGAVEDGREDAKQVLRRITHDVLLQALDRRRGNNGEGRSVRGLARLRMPSCHTG